MRRKAGPSIHDILENIQRVQAAMAGVSFADFQNDWQLRFAVQRAIEIISEASRRIPDELKMLRPEISGDVRPGSATCFVTNTKASPIR